MSWQVSLMSWMSYLPSPPSQGKPLSLSGARKSIVVTSWR
jgi:hypothetical protein